MRAGSICVRSPWRTPVSPRIVFIIAFNPALFEYGVVYGGQPQLIAANQISVFIDGVVGSKVTGYVTAPPVAPQR
jgi:hypothetical protein